ncbi:TF29 protein, partial [Pseudoatta argentina]
FLEGRNFKIVTDHKPLIHVRADEYYTLLTGEAIRPYIPASLRDRVFHLFHDAAHPGSKVTDRIIRQRYVWPNMHRDIAKWCKNCLDCQQSKITRHVQLQPEKFVAPDGRFEHVHMDLIGPLPESDGYRYSAIMCHTNEVWSRVLSTVLLGLRTHHKHKKRAFVFKDLYSCSHVFLRVGGIKRALERPYTGPHKVINCVSNRVFDIEVNGAQRSVSVENLIPAYGICDDLCSTIPEAGQAGNSFSNERPALRTYARSKRKVTFAI